MRILLQRRLPAEDRRHRATNPHEISGLAKILYKGQNGWVQRACLGVNSRIRLIQNLGFYKSGNFSRHAGIPDGRLIKMYVVKRVLRAAVRHRTGAEDVNTFHGEFLREFSIQEHSNRFFTHPA